MSTEHLTPSEALTTLLRDCETLTLDAISRMRADQKYIGAARHEVRQYFGRLRDDIAALAHSQETSYGPGTNTGHGHVWSRPDGVKARCGGPGMCQKCSLDKYQYGKRSALLVSGVAYCCACGEPLSAHVNGNCPKHVDPAAEASQPCKTHSQECPAGERSRADATADVLRALVSEISKTAFHQRERGMREMPDLLESYASRLAAVLTQEGAVSNSVVKESLTTVAPAEPRAAEGTGTGDFTWHNPAPFKSAAITGGVSKTMMAGCDSTSATECICPLFNCPVHTYRMPNTTAAAAVPAGEGAESAEWCAQAKLTMQRMFRFLQKIKAPYAIDCREWIDNAEKMLDAAPAPRGGVTEAWQSEAPTQPGIYAVRGWSLDDPPCIAVVQVKMFREELVCNIHCETTERDMRQWRPLRLRLSDSFEWQALTPPAAQAQDAGRSMLHWEYARALAAKEAK